MSDPLTVVSRAASVLAALLEKRRYYYEDREMKRLVLGDGGKSGENCEICEEAADMGWIDMDDVFPTWDGEVDEPPLHPNCTCTAEFRTRRKRVYL